MRDPLVYSIADAFQLNLHLLKDGTIRGASDVPLSIAGMWEVTAPVTVVVDEKSENLCTAFAKIYGNLWAYAMATTEGVTLMFFDGSRVKIRAGAEKEFGLGSAKATMARLLPHITRAFHCTHAHKVVGTWVPAELPKGV